MSEPIPHDTSAPELAVSLPTFLAQQREPLRWVVPGLIPNRGFVLLAGPQKVGKTWFAMELSTCLPTGDRFLGREVIQGPVIYVLEEGTHEGIGDRFRLLVKRHGTPPDTHLIVRSGIRTDEPEKWAAFTRDIARLRPVLVVVDPMVRLHSADENNSTDMARVMTRLHSLTDLGTAVLLLHHIGKRGGDEGSVGAAARGSGAIISSTDGNLILRREKAGLVLHTEMRDCESETLNLRFDPTTGCFECLGARAAGVPASPTSPGGITHQHLTEIASAEVQGGAAGLSVKRLAQIRNVSDETARKAIASGVKDKVLVAVGPSNDQRYRPAA